MNKFSIPILAIFASTLLTTPVFAGQANPHFIGTPTLTTSLTTGVTASGKAAGLDELPTAAFLTASKVTAQYVCVNHGGNIAPGQPLAFSNVVGPKQGITPHNGQITFTATIPPPPTPKSSDVCPNGNWSVQLQKLTYENVVLHIQQGNPPAPPDILSFTFQTTITIT